MIAFKTTFMHAFNLSSILFAGLMVGATALATDLYVSNAGNDTTGDGSEGAPWKTIQKAAGSSGAHAGDVVFVRGGTYPERVTVGVSGTSTAPIVFRNYPGEVPVLDQTGIAPTSGVGSVILLASKSYVTIQGFTIQNWRTSDPARLPVGIEVRGGGSGVHLRGNTIRNVEQNSPDSGDPGDGHGIKIYGTSFTPIRDLVIEGNELSNLRLGTSEAMAVNGNVVNFRVINNTVHDCNNIGIDLIGYEGTYTGQTTSTAIDRARDGVVADNTVYNIDSRFNPGYDGNFTTGGGDPSAGGIYVDGGSNIIIEHNLVYGCNFGMEIAAEDGAGKADFITVRNNLIRHNHQAGLIMGGSGGSHGATQNCLFANNTIYQNGTIATSAQIQIQRHVTNCTFKNNIVVAAPDVVFGVYGNGANSEFVGNTFLSNLYYASSGTPTFEAGSSRNLSQWQAASTISGGDVGSTVGNPLFQVNAPISSSPSAAYQLTPGSPAVDSGQASPAYVPGAGELDFFNKPRVRGGRVDRGFAEH